MSSNGFSLSANNKIPVVGEATQEWKLTDPDNFQYGRKIREGVYEFKEFDRNNYAINLDDYPTEDIFIDTIFDHSEFWEEMTIVMSQYTEEQIQKHISAYYKDVDEVKEIYGDDWEWIVAECIFEQESSLY